MPDGSDDALMEFQIQSKKYKVHMKMITLYFFFYKIIRAFVFVVEKCCVDRRAGKNHVEFSANTLSSAADVYSRRAANGGQFVSNLLQKLFSGGVVFAFHAKQRKIDPSAYRLSTRFDYL